MTHSWCKSPSRDEAVRAAEDGRSGPLPTLEECIERVTERRPVPPGGGGNVTPAASGAAGTGWLTEEEREALMRISHSLDYVQFFTSAHFIRSFLARSSPPEVVRPGKALAFRYGDDAIASRDGQWREALAAAGVKVKEVG